LPELKLTTCPSPQLSAVPPVAPTEVGLLPKMLISAFEGDLNRKLLAKAVELVLTLKQTL
jgi:hypothetical protein